MLAWGYGIYLHRKEKPQKKISIHLSELPRIDEPPMYFPSRNQTKQLIPKIKLLRLLPNNFLKNNPD